MLDLTDFKAVFAFDPKFSFSSDAQSQISGHRQELGGQLLFDRLLQVLHVQCKSYPPTSNKDLRELHKSIVGASIPSHHKQSLLYYILLDSYAYTPHSTRSRRGASHASQTSSTSGEPPAEVFARQIHLSERYTYAIQGLWNMDRLQFKPALDYLCQPSLLPTFPEAVMQTLVTAGQRDLVVAYVHSMGSLFDVGRIPNASREYFRLLGNSSIAEAYLYLHEQVTDNARQLFEMLIESALNTPVKGDKKKSPVREQRLSQLVNLPFTDEEVQWFEGFLIRGEGRCLMDAKVIAAKRLVACQRVREAKELTADLKFEKVVVIDGKEITMKFSFEEFLSDMMGTMGEVVRIDECWHEDSIYK